MWLIVYLRAVRRQVNLTKILCLTALLYALVFLFLHDRGNRLTSIFRSDYEVAETPTLAEVKISWSKAKFQSLMEAGDLEKGNKTQSYLINGPPFPIFLLATFRSGSSFIGQTIGSHPAIFYHFEPLMYLKYRRLMGPHLTDAVETISQLSQCRYDKLTGYFEDNPVIKGCLRNNPKIDTLCTNLSETYCFNLDALRAECNRFPLHLFKIVRLRGSAVEKLLEIFPNAKLVYLIRDPRAIYASRREESWCREEKTCIQIDDMCNSFEEDLTEFSKLEATHPDNVHLVRYEDIALDPLKGFKLIFETLGIRWNDDVENHIKSHINHDSNETLSTFKIPQLSVNRWHGRLDLKALTMVETSCSKFMDEFGYPRIKLRINGTLISNIPTRTEASNKMNTIL